MSALFLALLFSFSSARSYGQAFPIFNGTTNTCSGALLDSGGQGAGGYGNNENYTYTICPDAPGGAISLNFITFNLSTAGAAPIDLMAIYDGNSTAAPLLGSWTGTGLQGQVVSASAGNPTGCLTVVFRSNNTGVGVFAAAITCYQPCTRPTAAATHGTAGPQRICPGESITFNSTASFAAPGFVIASRRWEFGDGAIQNNAPAVVSHTYTQPGAYTAQLYLLDNNGCASTNRVDLLVLVGTEPTFTGTTGQLTGCVGETLCLDGVVNGTTWNELPGTNLGSGVFLPDDVGECFTSELTFTQFAPGQTLTNANGILTICMDIEHSFIGDLVISIISPTGQSVVLHQQGGGATFLGIPVDDDLSPNDQGTCWNYCWSASATNGTWADNAGATLPSGTYESLNSLAGLVGSQLNGTWSIQVCDLWASDNGFICNWGIDFDPSLYDELIEFTPIYGNSCDSTSWSGPNISSTSGDCDQICVTPPGPGNYNYLYTVTDNFGCTYDTTLTVTIVPGPQVNAGPDASTCNTPVQLGASITSGGFPTDCNYVLTLYDDFDDGWTGLFGIGSNGSNVTITVNGVSSSWTLPNGGQGSVNIPVTAGDVITVSYTAGNIYNGEQSYTLFNGSGGVVYASPLGPGSGVAWSGVANCPGGTFVYSWTPAAGLNNPNIANPIATVGATTEYCVTVHQAGHPDCTSTDCMTITIDNTVDAGTNGSVVVCANAPALTLLNQLGGTPTAGGAWTNPSGGAHSGTFVPGADGPGVYTYTVTGSGACGSASATSTVTIAVSPIADAGTSSSVSLCSNSGSIGLTSQLGGTPQAGGTWTAPGGGAFAGTFDPAVHAAGVYTYTVVGTAPCPPSTATLSISVSSPPNAGADNSITLCTSDAPMVLVTQLGGTPEGTGTWTDPSGATISGGIDPATATSGVYTYTVPGVAPCPNDVAQLTVAINSPPDPGTDGTITLCSSDAAVSLFAQLGGTPDVGGAWSGPSAVGGDSFDPATMAAGAYTYTVNGLTPCPAESATVTVSINTPPDPGTDGTITLCSSDAAVSLFAQLGGTADVGGAWSGPSAVVGDSFDPATMAAGAYTYTVNGLAPCPVETATVTVSINTPPDPGTDGTITLCSSDAAVSLFSQLGGTADVGGAWSGPSAVVGDSFDPATMADGVYSYTVNGIAPCPAETATVTVNINTPPDPGTDGTITLCSSDAAVSLFAQLGGTPDVGGAWNGPSAVVGDSFDPATMIAGAYTYTVNGLAPCPSESATVTVAINTPPDPGTDGTITLCSSDAAVSLFAELGGTPDAGGAWSGPSAVVGDSFDPATMTAGAYTYTVNGLAPCPSESATVTVAINTPPDPGTDGTITLCSSDAAVSLFAQLGGTPDAGGAWSGPSAVVGDSFDPATMTAGVYTYTVNGFAPCPAETATVTVNINTPPDPGTDGTITLCSSDAAASLFAQLGGTPDVGGAWNGPSAVVGDSFDPATMTAGVYTYTVNGVAPCPALTSEVLVIVNPMPDAGIDGGLTLCSSSPTTNLVDGLNGSPDAGGIWTAPDGGPSNGAFTPGSSIAGSYTYTVNGVAPCPAVAAEVVVNVVTNPDAGTPGSTTLCVTDAPLLLFNELGGTPDAGGSWNGPSAVIGGLYDPATMNPGIYTYTITVPPPCVNASSTVTISEVAPPNAGNDGAITLCISSPATSLFAALGGAAQAGGSWSGPSTVTAGQFDPATMDAGVYTYTVNGTAPCPNDAATVTVTVVSAPDAGTPVTATLCSTDTSIDLFTELGGTPDLGGTWSGPSAVIGGLYDPATMNPGVYTYTITVPPPCVNASSTVTITEVAPPNAGGDGAIILCISSPATSLFAALGGAAQAGGSWSGPSTVTAGQFDPATMDAGVYTYTVNGTAPCPNDAATVTVTVVSAPDAGTPGTAALCNTDTSIDLFTELGGTPDLGGTWSGPSAVIGGLYDPATMNPGVYTYTITVPAPCVNVSSTVEVTTVQAPDAGDDGALTLCITGATALLVDGLGGSPDVGGTWSGPSTVTNGQFLPATMLAGTYNYTVAGQTPCPADVASVVVTVSSEPDPGGPGFLSICASDNATDLFERLEGSPDAGGVWAMPDGAVFSGLLDPASMPSGVYTYSITVPPPCTSVSSTVTVEVVLPPNAGEDGTLTLCATGAPEALFGSLGGDTDPNGSWSTGTGAPWTGIFDPNTDSPGDMVYTVNGTSPCPQDIAVVSVSVIAPPVPGTDDIVNLCITGSPVDLFPALGTADPGGVWTSSTGAAFTGVFTPGMDQAGDFTYSVAGTAPCPAASAVITVNVITDADAGADGANTLCVSNPPSPLFNLLGGTPDAGGDWFDPFGNAVNGTFDPSSQIAGIYTYIVAVPAPCLNDTSVVTIAITQEVNAGLDGSVTLCSNDGAIELFDGLGGAPDPGGSWSGPGGYSSGLFTPASDLPGTYQYTVTASAPCPNAVAMVEVTVHPLPDAGADGSLSVCPGSAAIDLFSLLGGSPDTGGAWIGPTGLSGTGTFTPSEDIPGTYTYTVAGTAPCPDASASATVTIHVVPQPDAGPDAFTCTLGTSMTAEGDWVSGTWSGPSGISFGDVSSGSTSVAALQGGTYTLTWSTLSAEGCTAMDTVSITFTDDIIPMVSVTDAVCNGSCDGSASVQATGGNTIAGAYDYDWSDAAAGNVAQATGLCAGTYSVTVLDANGCNATATFTIGEPEPLVIDAIFDVDETCPGSCDGQVVVQDPEGALYSIDGGENVQAANSFNGLCPGEYAVMMQDANGCTSSGVAFIGSPMPVEAAFLINPDTLFIDEPTADLINTSSSNATTFLWDFGTGDTSAETSPSYSFPGGLGATYTVCLTAMDANGCTDSVCAPIQVFDLLLVHVANAFTPNGDGFNDGFAPVFNQPWVSDYEFLIFDRWGEKIFESRTVDEQWTGRYGSDVVETEVYVWKLTCKDQLTGEQIERIGHVSVLK